MTGPTVAVKSNRSYIPLVPESHKPTLTTPEQRFAQLMREKREALGWTQEELARHVSTATKSTFHQTAVTRIEGMQRNIRLNEVVAIAQVLGIDTGLFEDPDPDDVKLEADLLTAIERLQDAREEQNEHAYRLRVEMDNAEQRYQALLAKIEVTNAEISRHQWSLENLRQRMNLRTGNGDR